jgi:hypothetical protein
MSFSHQTAQLSPGCHASPDAGVCVMELASILAGERFCDHPRAVSRTLAALLRGYNDGLDDERRQTLKRFAAEAVGTAGTRATERYRRAILRAGMIEPGEAASPLGRMARRIDAAAPYGYGYMKGRAVARREDDARHARMLALLDALIALGEPRDPSPYTTPRDRETPTLTGT